MSFYILKITGSGLAFGLSLAISALPKSALSPLAGILSDKFSRKWQLVVYDLLSGITLFLIYLVSMNNRLSYSMIIFSITAMNALNTFYSINLAASLPCIVDKEYLGKLNYTSQSISSLSRIIGPFIGGILIAVIDIRLFVLVNALSFLISALLESFISFRIDVTSNKKQSQQKLLRRFISEFKVGVQYSTQHSLISTLITHMVLLNVAFNFGYTVAIPFIINTQLALGPIIFGLSMGATSFGGFLVSILLSMIDMKDRKRSLLLGLTGLSGSLMMFSILSSYIRSYNASMYAIASLIFTCAILGASIVIASVSFNILLQMNTENEYLGRIFSLSSLTSNLLTPLILILSGFFVNSVNPISIVMFSGLFLLVITIELRYNKKFSFKTVSLIDQSER